LPLDLVDKRVDKLKAVTPEQVKQAAKLLTDDNLAIAVLDPQPITGNAPRPALEGVDNVR
jgi:predicted Zn-dependent peptidase